MNTQENRSSWLDGLLKRLGANQYRIHETRLSLTYAFWCLLWAVVVTVSDYVVERELIAEAWVWPVVLLPIAMTPIVFYQYYRFYSGVDELTRKIQAEALAIGFGIGMFILIAFMSLANVGFEEPGVNESIAIFAFSYVFGQLIRTWWYHK